MFGDGGTPEERLAQLREDRSILDWVTADITRVFVFTLGKEQANRAYPSPSSLWYKSNVAPRPVMRPSGKAKRGRMPAVFDR